MKSQIMAKPDELYNANDDFDRTEHYYATRGDHNDDIATLTINTPEGPMYVQSGDPNVVEIGAIYLPKGSTLDVKGTAKVGEVSIGTEKGVDHFLDRVDGDDRAAVREPGAVGTAEIPRYLSEILRSDSGAMAVTTIAITLIVFAVIAVLGWRALSAQSHQDR